MSNTNGSRKGKRKPKPPPMPAWELAELQELRNWLTRLMESANRAAGSAAFAQGIDDDPCWVNAEAYWKNVRSGIKWVRGMVGKQIIAQQKRQEEEDNAHPRPRRSR